jgi:spore coat protein U-like protein
MFAAALAQGQVCQFNGNPSGITFAAFDPSVATTQTAFTDVKIKCTPASTTPTWSFSSANGGASPRMKHSVQSVYIPYTMAASFQGSTGSNQNWRLTATVLGQDYQNAYVGSYSDILTATVTP